MEFTIGQVVFSKAGRDKGDVFVVYDVNGEYLYLVDGVGRPLERPKKKKKMHVQPTKEVILIKGYNKNADFRAALKRFADKREENNG